MKGLKFAKKLICSTIIGLMVLPNGIIPQAIATESATLTAQDCPYDIQFTQINAGAEHMVAIDSNGDLWTWGSNDAGQIGNGEQGINACQSVPLNISEKIQGYPIFRKVNAGDYNTAAIDIQGNLWTWGSNGKGQLGNGTKTASYIPINISNTLENSTKFKEISVGGSHMSAIDIEGNLWVWGSNDYSQLGIPNSSLDTTKPINITEQIQGNVKFSKISSSDYYTAGIDVDGNLWKWGNGVRVPTIVEENTKFSQVSLGYLTSSAIDTEGNLWDLDNQTILINDGTKFTDVSSYGYCSIAIDEDGDYWAWGTSKYLSVFSDVPQKVELQVEFNKISTGNQFMAGLDKSGNLWMCGDNSSGQLGNGVVNYTTQTIPIQITRVNNTQAPDLEPESDPEPEDRTLTVNPGSTQYTQKEGTTKQVVAPQITIVYNYNGSGKTSTMEKPQFNRWILTGKGSIDNASSSSVTYTYGEANGTLTARYSPVTLPTPTRDGYVFNGWYTSATGGSKVGEGNTSYTATQNVVLYAHWQEEKVYLIPSNTYQISENENEEDACIYRVNPNITIKTLKDALQTNGTASVYKKVGDTEELINDNETLGTGMIVRIEKNGETIEYEVSVKGDVDGNGEVTPTDLAVMKQQIIKEISLEGVQYLSLDISNDGEITATDLAAMKQVSIGELDLSTIE